MEYETRSGLRVVDNRRGLPPRDVLPNDTPPGDNPGEPYSPVSVGPNASEGFGNTHVMYPLGNPPLEASAWSGWPVGWATPNNTSGFLGSFGHLCDVVFACIDINSSILSSMPPYAVKDGNPVENPSWIVNPEPLVYNSWQDFAKEVFWSYYGVGEVFIYATARYSDGHAARFVVVNPAYVNVDVINGRKEYRIHGEPVDPADVLHLKYVSWPGTARGIGPLEVAGARLLACAAMSHYSSELASNGGIPWAVLKYPKRVSRAQMRQMQTDWMNARRSSMGLPAVLADGVELDVLSTSPKDMALSEQQKFNESRLAVLLSVPPFLVGLPGGDSMTYSNVNMLFSFHWRAYLRPRASAVMAALSNWALPRGTGIELNRDEYVRAEPYERAQTQEIYARIGVLSVEEIRAAERFGGPAPDVPATVAITSADH